MGKLFLFEHQNSAENCYNKKIIDTMQELLSKYSWRSHGESLSGRLGFKMLDILLLERKLKISLCTSDDLKNTIIIEIIRDITVEGMYDGPRAEESCLIFDSNSVYSIQRYITGWGFRISYGQGKVVFAQSMRWVLDRAGIDTGQYIFFRDADLDEANGYQEGLRVHTMAKTVFSLNSIEKNMIHPEERIAIGVVGGFLHGSSSVINAILGEEVLPVDILPTTSVVTRITYGPVPHVNLFMKDGTQQEISVKNLPDYVAEFDADSRQRALKVEEAIVRYPCPFCQNGVDIIDMPGINNNNDNDSITVKAISKLDAVVMVLNVGFPFSLSEADFLRDVLMRHIGIERILFVVNRMDTVREYADRNQIVEDIRKRIVNCIIEFFEYCEKCLNENSRKRCFSSEEILMHIKVLPFSAREALEGRLNNDQYLLEKSGLTELEFALNLIAQEIKR